MKKTIRTTIYVLFSILFLVSSLEAAPPARKKAASKKSEKHFLWEVKSGKATVYILGSIHLAKAELYPLPKVMEDSFTKSDNLVLEINLNNMDVTQELIQRAMYTDTTNSLEKNISPEAYRAMEYFFSKYKIQKFIYDRFKPWFAAMTIQQLSLLNEGYKPEYGLDMHFLNEANEKKMSVLELESVQDQLNIFKKELSKYQSEFVEYTLDDFNSTNQNVEAIFKYWKAGDTAGLRKVMMGGTSDNAKYQEIEKALIDNRNFKMVDKIDGYLKTDKTYFVIVGSGHLVGQNGILSLLTKKKYTVKQL